MKLTPELKNVLKISKKVKSSSASKENSKYSLLKINIETGRKNQIRVQLANICHPIVGDNKYGENDSFKKLYLHANKLKLFYPILKKEIVFQTDIPQDYKKLI